MAMCFVQHYAGADLCYTGDHCGPLDITVMKLPKYHHHPCVIDVKMRVTDTLYERLPKGIDKVCILFIMRKIKEVR